MFKIKLLKKSFFLLFFLLVLNADAQYGIFFQAIARDNNTNPAKNRKIFIQSNIIASSPTGTIVLIEEHQTNTDDFGVFSIMVGNGIRVGGVASDLSTIDWSNGPYFLNLKIAITPVGVGIAWDYNKEWINLGTTVFGTVPFALYSANTSKINDKLNISDTSKMLEPYAKAITVQMLSSSIETKLTAKDTSAMLSSYSRITYVDSALGTKLLLKDTIKYAKQMYTDSALITKLSINGNALTATIAGNITATTNTSLISLSNLSTVGVITTGAWSSTTIGIAHGGTGLTSAGLAGQALTTSSAGTLTWTNVAELMGTHYIGESFGGGSVFHVYDNGKHGLIVSTEDQSSGGVLWYNGSYITTNAFRDGVNAGLLNTERVILSQGSGNYAAQLAANYKGGGYGDWYLPSAYELGLLHLQRALFFTGSNVIYYYFSSNENPNNNKQVMCYRFTPTIYNTYLDKLNNQVRIRAIRAF
jgi:hypothetical protein